MVRSITEIVYTDEDRNSQVFCDKVRDIYSKWQISPLMVSHEFTAYIYAADLVNSSEMKKKPLAVHIQTAFPGAGLRGNTTGLHLAEAVCLPEKVVLPVKMEPGSVRQRGSIHFHKTDVAEFVCL